ncbi:MAG: hypothetical protein P5698_15560, partial [Limnospira sp. PMC 1295.21]|uniref:hypothetical protein n=1 Tax=Limnospira sp. PMC 1295.21 TaxID=2981078 RepID=UPI0028E1732E
LRVGRYNSQQNPRGRVYRAGLFIFGWGDIIHSRTRPYIVHRGNHQQLKAEDRGRVYSSSGGEI